MNQLASTDLETLTELNALYIQCVAQADATTSNHQTHAASGTLVVPISIPRGVSVQRDDLREQQPG